MREGDEGFAACPRSRFIHKHVSLPATGDAENCIEAVNCHILIDHYGILQANQQTDEARDPNYGGLVLYFPDLAQVLRINLRESTNVDQAGNAKAGKLGGFLRDLKDDRVYLRRLPRQMGVGGYVLLAFFGCELQAFHIYFSNRSQRLE